MDNVALKASDAAGTVIALAGRIDSNNAQQVREAIQAVRAAAPDGLLRFDAAGLEYISSAGLRVFLAIQKQEPEKLRIVNASEAVYDIFDMTGFTEILDVHRPIRTIRIDGAKRIGRGSNGEIFRVDADTIYKVYSPGTPMAEVDRERELAKLAFLKGIPTAISYDTAVTEDGRLAIGFEMLGSDTLSSVMAAQPERFDELARAYVSTYRTFHELKTLPGEFPSVKELYHGYIDGCVGWYSAAELEALRTLVDSVPDRDTLIHGDYHPRNIMCSGGELIMIDMGDISRGHPIFDFLATAATQANLVDLNPAYAEAHTGMPAEYIRRLWQTMLRLYFAGKTEGEIASIDRQIRLFSRLKVALAPVVGRGLPQELIQASVDDAKRNLLPRISDLAGSVNW